RSAPDRGGNCPAARADAAAGVTLRAIVRVIAAEGWLGPCPVSRRASARPRRPALAAGRNAAAAPRSPRVAPPGAPMIATDQSMSCATAASLRWPPARRSAAHGRGILPDRPASPDPPRAPLGAAPHTRPFQTIGKL